MKRLLLCLAPAACCRLLLPSAALAANGEKTPLDLGAAGSAGAHAASGGSGTLVRTIVGLAIVLAVIYGLHWVLKQVKGSRRQGRSGAGLASLATLPLGPKGALHLVRAGAEVLLVGVGDGGVTPIRAYSDAEARSCGLLDDEEEAGGSVRLGAVMDAGSQRRGTLRRVVEDLRERTVLK